MSEEASLLTLPIEILHGIFNELDGETLFLSVRNTCQQLRAAVSSHHRYALDFTSISKPNFHRLLRLIRPECVTSLSLADGEIIPVHIHRFLSSVDIHCFTRLRSLTLTNINEQDFCSFLEHAKNCAITSLIFHLRSVDRSRVHQIAQYLSLIIAQPSLRRLELLLEREATLLISLVQWSPQSKLRYLSTKCQPSALMIAMITALPELETLVLRHETADLDIFANLIDQFCLFPSCPQLTSLTLSNFCLPMHAVRSLLSQTPSLRHLKIITSPNYIIDGSEWEELIASELPFLSEFQFYSYINYHSLRMKETIAPFRTPFWTEQKRWFVILNIFPSTRGAQMYTSPICVPYYTYMADPQTVTISNFERDDQHSRILECVDEFRVDLSKMLRDPRYFEANYLESLSQPFSTMIDLSKVTKLSLNYTPSDFIGYPLRSDWLIDLLQQTSNIRSLTLDRRLAWKRFGPSGEDIYSMIIQYVDPSKLRHLTIPITNVNQVKRLLDRFRNLCSIQFVPWTEDISSREIIAYTNTSMAGCLIGRDSSFVLIWLGERVETTYAQQPTTRRQTHQQTRLLSCFVESLRHVGALFKRRS